MKHNNKLLKMITMFVLTIFIINMCLVISPITKASATENDTVDEDMIVIYAKVLEDWNEPCLWAWGEDGTNAFEAWPGGAMKADENNQGWYYLYVPSWVSSVIVNANEGTVQTTDLPTDSKNAWITVASPEEALLTNEQLTAGELPEYISMIKINAKVPEDWLMPSLWAWSAPDGTNVYANWPGQELVESTDGWYSLEVPAWVNSAIINGNLGEVQTSDISIESKDIWIIVEDAENYEISYEKPAVEVPEEEMITIRAKAPEDWLLPSLWAWSAPDGTNVFANWPGQELELDGEWYTYAVPNWVNSIIINGTLGSVQTTDISIEPKDVWVVISSADSYEIYYEEPADSQVVEKEEEAQPEIAVEEEAQPAMAVEEEVVSTNESSSSNKGVAAVVGVAAIAAIGGGAFVYNKKK